MSDDTTDSAAESAHDWFPLDELTTRLAELAWVEQQLADVVATWVPTTPEADVSVAFARSSEHHRWHAELLVDVLATSPQLAANDRIDAPTSGWRAAVDQLADLNDTQARLASLVRVIDPWLDREIGALRDLANPLSDRDHDRILAFISLDHETDNRELAELFASYQDRPIDLARRREIGEIDLS